MTNLRMDELIGGWATLKLDFALGRLRASTSSMRKFVNSSIRA